MTCYDIPFLGLGFLILKKNVVAILVAILLALSILSLAAVFIASPEVFPARVHMNKVHTQANWTLIACVVAPLVGLYVLALLAHRSSRPAAKSRVK